MLNRIGTIALLSLLLPALIHAQPDTSSTLPAGGVSIVGRVFDAETQQPLIGASVRLVGTRRGAVARSDGSFTIAELAPGTYQLSVSSAGYVPFVQSDVVVSNARPASVEIGLQRKRSTSVITVRPDYFSRGGSNSVSTQQLSAEEVRRVPGGFEDVVRAVSTLPGVAQAQNGRNDLLVRGGAPSENLFLIDNLEVPNINHFGTQGSGGGPLSFVNLDFVQNVSFSTGGFGVKYGDRISSVLSLDLREGRTDHTGGKATISASQFGLNVEGPLTDAASYLFSARRSYLDLIFRASGFSFVPEYWDFLGKVNWKLGERDNLSALAIAALDNVRQFNDDPDDRFKNSRILDNSQDQLVAGLTWRHLLDNGVVTTTFGRTRVAYRFQQNDTLGVPIFSNQSLEDELSLRSDMFLQVGDATELTAGAIARTVGFESDLAVNQPGFALDVAPRERFTKGGAYLQLAETFPWGMRATVGGRLDYFDGVEEKINPSLRFALAQPLDESSTVNVSAGRYYQTPSYIWLASNDQNRALRSIRTDQIVFGVDRVLQEDLRVSLEGYYKSYGDYPASAQRPWLVLANTGAGFGGADDGFAAFGIDPLVSEGRGRAYGLELLVQKKLSEIRCYGILSVSLGRSLFTALDGIERPGSYDQRLLLNLSGGYQLSDLWEFGLKFRYAAGRPYTPVGENGDPASGYQIISLYNAERLGPGHALDLRVDRRWPFASWTLITYIDVQNVYNRKNPVPPRWNERTRQGESESAIGILPSIGVSAEF